MGETMKSLPLYCPQCGSAENHFRRGDENAWCDLCGFFPIYAVEPSEEKPTMTTMTRITEPDSNQHLRILDVMAILDDLYLHNGNLPCYIYSADRKALVPLLPLCIAADDKRRVYFAAQTGSVCEEMYEDLREENERLRQALRSQP